MRFSAVRLGKAIEGTTSKFDPNLFLKFYNGNHFPRFGLGTYQLSGASDIVKCAIDIGYRHFDCAHVYQNEEDIGRAIKNKIRANVVKRQDLYITSKLWNTFHRPDLVRPALLETLKNLELDYVDLYLIHWPMAYKEGRKLFPLKDNKMEFSDVDYIDTWKEMEKAYHEGLATNIGVSNFNSEQLRRLIENCKVKPVTNQIEVHPYLNQSCLRSFCKCHNIVVTAYSPLGAPGNSLAQAEHKKLLQDEWLTKRAKELNKNPAQLCLRWNLQCDNIVIPKSGNKEHIASNFDIFDFKLTNEDMECFDKMNKDKRIFMLENAFGHKYHPFEHAQM